MMSKLFKTINEKRIQKKLTDVRILPSDGNPIYAHQLILSSVDWTIRNTIAEKNSKDLDISVSVSNCEMRKIIEYIYTDQIQLNSVSEITAMINPANNLQFFDLIDLIKRKLKAKLENERDINNFLPIWKCIREVRWDTMESELKRWLRPNIKQFLSQSSNQMTYEELIYFIETYEESLDPFFCYQIIKNWGQVDFPARKFDLEALFKKFVQWQEIRHKEHLMLLKNDEFLSNNFGAIMVDIIKFLYNCQTNERDILNWDSYPED